MAAVHLAHGTTHAGEFVLIEWLRLLAIWSADHRRLASLGESVELAVFDAYRSVPGQHTADDAS